MICAVQVRADLAGRALSPTMVAALVDHALRHHLPQVIAPLRPTLKHRYPLTPIGEYVGWTRDDGQPFDPWVRSHTRLGAEVIGVEDASQVFTGSVAQWEEWSGLRLPTTGSYIVPDALAPLSIDCETDTGICREPGIWVRQR